MSFEIKYSLHEQLGQGAFSVVHMCRKRSDGQSFAVKIVDLRPLRLSSKFDPQRLMREVDIMREAIEHKNIIKLMEVFEPTPGDDRLLMVMELVKGTELFDAILATKRLRDGEPGYDEARARPIFIQVSFSNHTTVCCACACGFYSAVFEYK